MSYALILACIGVFLGTTGLGDEVGKQAELELADAYAYWESHPYLEPPGRLVAFYGDPGREHREAYRASLAEREAIPAPILAVQQKRLEELVSRADGILAEHPWYRFGLVPAAPRPEGVLGHMFLHAGWMHLLSNLFLLFLTGPFIEDRWGRIPYLLFYLCAGVAGAALFAMQHADLDGPLVGASGAIAGCMGAFLVRFWNRRIRFFYWLGFFFGTFEAPAWLILLPWFAGELASAAGSAPGGVAYWAHVGGFAFGSLAALALAASGIETRLARSLGVEPGSQDPEDGLAELEPGQGPLPEPGDGNALPGLPMPGQDGLPSHAADASQLEAALRGGRREAAVEAWLGLPDEALASGLGANGLVRLAGWLREGGHPGAAGAALRVALPEADGATALRIAKVARRLSPVVALAAAERGLEQPDLGAEERQALEALLPRIRQALEASGIVIVAPDAPVERRRVASAGVVCASPAPSDYPDAMDFDARAIELPEEPPLLSSDPGAEEGYLDDLHASLTGGAPAAAAPEVADDAATVAELVAAEPDLEATQASLQDLAPDPDSEATVASFEESELELEPAAVEDLLADLHEATEEPKPEEAPPPRLLEVRQAEPLGLDEQHLRVRLAGRDAARLPLHRVDAVAVAGVQGLGRDGKAVLLIDLVMGWRDPAAPLRVVRLRSDGFDPRKLVGAEGGSPLQALRRFAAELTRRAHAEPLPQGADPEAPFRIFQELERYEAEVLGASSA